MIRYKKEQKLNFSEILNKYYKSLINVNFIFTLYFWDKEDLILFLHDFVLVIEPEIMALFGIACQKLFHFVFIKTQRTVVAVLVIFHKICALVTTISHCCHRPLKAVLIIGIFFIVVYLLKNLLFGICYGKEFKTIVTHKAL